jgi:hypothetical protein
MTKIRAFQPCLALLQAIALLCKEGIKVTNPFQNERKPFCATRDDQAPSFSTKGFVNGEIHTFELEQYKGKWLLLFFYPSDFTPV